MGQTRKFQTEPISRNAFYVNALRGDLAEHHPSPSAGGGREIRRAAAPGLVAQDGERDGFLGVDVDAEIRRRRNRHAGVAASSDAHLTGIVEAWAGVTALGSEQSEHGRDVQVRDGGGQYGNCAEPRTEELTDDSQTQCSHVVWDLRLAP